MTKDDIYLNLEDNDRHISQLENKLRNTESLAPIQVYIQLEEQKNLTMFYHKRCKLLSDLLDQCED